MSKHLVRDLEKLKCDLLTMGAMVEEATNMAIAAIVDRRPELSQEVIDGDVVIDEREVRIEEDCLKILALHQPVAADLRFVIVALKVNNDLERMGDLAVNIAERSAFLCKDGSLGLPVDFDRMVEDVRTMVRDSLDSLVNLDIEKSRRVLEIDDEVDRFNRAMFRGLHEIMHSDPSTIDRAVHTLSVSKHLERIADHATNIAEDVIFMVDGEVVRHRHVGGEIVPSDRN